MLSFRGTSIAGSQSNGLRCIVGTRRSPAQIGVRTETVSAAVLGRIDGTIATLRRVFQTVSQSAARQFEATRAGALDFVDANDADKATAVIDGDNYAPRTGDQRRVTARQIRERRGQRAFRDAGAATITAGARAVTGCTVLDLLEAAHIKPYRGDRDNNPQNGLLLRADNHTLFDLDLLGIEPEQLRIELNPKIAADGQYKLLAGRAIDCEQGQSPSRSAAKYDISSFSRGLQTTLAGSPAHSCGIHVRHPLRGSGHSALRIPHL